MDDLQDTTSLEVLELELLVQIQNLISPLSADIKGLSSRPCELESVKELDLAW